VIGESDPPAEKSDEVTASDSGLISQSGSLVVANGLAVDETSPLAGESDRLAGRKCAAIFTWRCADDTRRFATRAEKCAVSRNRPRGDSSTD
jgi:hypothetical protein